MKRVILFMLFIISFVFISNAFALSPEITSGLSYLSTTQNPDGSWNSDTTDVLPATVSVIETLQVLDETSSQSYADSISWLQAQDIETTGYLSERIRALSDAGTDRDILLSYIDDTYTGAYGGYIK